MSQNCDSGRSFDEKKTGIFSCFFLIKFSTFHKIKTKAYIKTLRHISLHMNVIYKYCTFCASIYITEQIILEK